MSFTHLHVHSMFSLFDGLSKPEEIVDRVKYLGHSSVAITDHGTMSGAIPFNKECRKAGIKPIIGMEAYFIPEPEVKERGFHLILLASNNYGYQNLLKIDSIASQHMYYKPRIPWADLVENSYGIICLSACMASIINTDEGFDWAKSFKQIFGEDFYLEIQSNTMYEQIEYNNKVIEISKQLEIPLVVTTDAHYPDYWDSDTHRRWVFANKKEREDYYTTNDFYLQSEDEIRSCLRPYIADEILDQAIANTGKIADMCDVNIEVEGNHYPVYKCENPLEEIQKICNEGWKQKITPNIPKAEWPKYKARAQEELAVLDKCGYLNYLLITQDVLNWCAANGILTGVGRGSAGGSLVCYLMNITKIDPIKYDLLFSRFVNPDRVTPCDIDSDIDSERREEVIEYIRQKYGHVYNIRTFNFLGVKNAIKRAGQTLGRTPTECNEATKGVETWNDVKIDSEWLELAKRFEGLVDSFGCHASAVLIFPDDPSNYCPIEKQGDKFLAAYDYHDLEAMGLLKMDILGLSNLTVIANTMKSIGTKLDIYNLPMKEKDVYDIYANGELSSIFQAESSGMRSLATKTNVHCFDEVIALMALYRPGPLDSGMVEQYIDGKLGGEVRYLHPTLEPILKSTYGVIVYQEQVISIVQLMARMTPGEADNFRRIIGRKELEKIKTAVNEFVERSIENGYPSSVAIEIGRQIEACGGYIFNKSHAAAYGYTSYITAFLKVRFPVKYMCAVLNNEIGDIEKTAEYINECRRMGIEVLPPDINISGSGFTVEGKNIRFGLGSIKNCGNAVIELIEKRPFASLDRILEKCSTKINKRVLESLIKAGALASIENKPKGLLLALLDNAKEKTKCRKLAVEDVVAYDINEALVEYEVLGLYLTTSPYEKHEEYLTGYGTLSYAEFLNSSIKSSRNPSPGDFIVVGGLVTKMTNKDLKAKNGSVFGFITIDFMSGGTLDIIFFGERWLEIKRMVKPNSVIRVQGLKTGSLKFTGNKIHLLV